MSIGLLLLSPLVKYRSIISIYIYIYDWGHYFSCCFCYQLSCALFTRAGYRFLFESAMTYNNLATKLNSPNFLLSVEPITCYPISSQNLPTLRIRTSIWRIMKEWTVMCNLHTFVMLSILFLFKFVFVCLQFLDLNVYSLIHVMFPWAIKKMNIHWSVWLYVCNGCLIRPMFIVNSITCLQACNILVCLVYSKDVTSLFGEQADDLCCPTH